MASNSVYKINTVHGAGTEYKVKPPHLCFLFPTVPCSYTTRFYCPGDRKEHISQLVITLQYFCTCHIGLRPYSELLTLNKPM